MYNKLLKPFVKAADCGSFSAAAKEMFISTNALKKQIDLLEKELGVKLFDRSSRGITLTSVGEYIYAESVKMMSWSFDVLRHASELENSDRMIIRLGISQFYNNRSVLAEIDEFMDAHPEIHMQIVPYNGSNDRFRMFSDVGKDVDVILSPIQNKYLEKKYRSIEMYKTNICGFVPRSNPLSKKSYILPEEMSGYSVLVIKYGVAEDYDNARKILEGTKGVNIVDLEYFDYRDFNYASLGDDRVILGPDNCDDCIPMLRKVPIKWECRMPFGLVYSERSTGALDRMITYLAKKKNTYMFEWQMQNKNNPDSMIHEDWLNV